MPEWTPMQEAAISARGASLVVSAAAGSGKTAVLVERIIRMLEDEALGCKAEDLVVVTYTNDAAAEIRRRLNLALSRRVAAFPDSAWLRRQLNLLPSMQVSTIHSFCFSLLREQSAKLHISAGFRVMDETEDAALRRAVTGQVLEDFSAAAEQDKAIRTQQQMLWSAFSTGSDKPVEELLLTLYKRTRTAVFGDTLLIDAAKACEDGSIVRMAFSELSAVVRETILLYEKAISYNRMMDASDAKAAAASQAVLTQELVQATAVQEALLHEDTEAIADALSELVFPTLRLSKKQDNKAAANMVKALRNRAKDLLLKIGNKKTDKSPNKWVSAMRFAEVDLQRSAELLRICDQLVRQITDRVMIEKQERNAIGFDDALTLALSLLAIRKDDGSITKTALAEQLSSQYASVMIDEFQDEDDLRELIFRMLSKGGTQQKYGSNLFVVGDSKQCIYRFSNANPENFYRAMQEGAPYRTPALTENTRIDLNCNFRSCAEVIAVINHIFGQLMTESVGEVDYDDSQKLVQGAEYPESEGGRPAEVLLLEEGADEPSAVAARIAWHLYENHTPVKAPDGSLQPCAPRDFLVLLRNSKHMPEYADALKAVGVPVCAIGQENYLLSPEITLLLDVLRAVDNPMLDVSVAAVMLSPLFGFSLDELVMLRVYRQRENLFRAMQHLCAEQDNPEITKDLSEKCRGFLAFLEEMRLCSAMDTPEQLIRRIYQQTDFIGILQMTDETGQKKANLRAIVQFAKGYEERTGGGLSALLRVIDRMIEQQTKLDGGSVPAAGNVVSMKTIHKSKGLEAPFVVLAGMGSAFSTMDERSVCRYHHEVGVGFKLYDEASLSEDRTLPWLVISARSKRESRSEELRLFYVALTRARERLILPLKDVSAEKALAYAVEQAAFSGQTDLLTATARSMQDWLLMALIRNPSCEMLRRSLAIECDSDGGQPLLPIRFVRVEEADARTGESSDDAHSVIQVDEALMETLRAQCAWTYSDRLAGLTAKYGVSELAKQENFSAPLRRPLFVREQHGLSGAERGTALHTFMQYADFEKAAAALPEEIDRLEQLGRLTKKQAAAVRRSQVQDFFSSELYSRIAKAQCVWREQKFTVRLSDLSLTGDLAALGAQYKGTEGMLIGIMDLVFEEPDGIVLVDYKTDAVQSQGELLEKYTDQIRLYAAALALLMDKPVKSCYLYSMKLSRTIAVL